MDAATKRAQKIARFRVERAALAKLETVKLQVCSDTSHTQTWCTQAVLHVKKFHNLLLHACHMYMHLKAT